MTDKKRLQAEQRQARAKALADAKRNQINILDEMGITPAEAALFNVLHYGMTHPPDHLPSAAAIPDYSLTEPLHEEECRAALSDCLAKGWLQVVDESTLDTLVREHQEADIVGPIYRYPEVGGVDFTRTGAELWLQLSRRCFPRNGPPFPFTDVVHSKSAYFFRTEQAALESIPEDDPDFATRVDGPTRIGPWRLQWWRRFSEGYRIDIEHRMRWQGGGGGSGPSFVLPLGRLTSEPQRLLHVLDCHNVTLGEYVCLAMMERSWCWSVSRFASLASQVAREQFGATISEGECRAGLEACVRYGWLRFVDETAVNEVRRLLRDDPVFLPVPDKVKRRVGELDFTSEGAILYRRLVTEWLGPDWEDACSVWDDYFREEHRYCESEEVLRAIPREYEANGEVIHSANILAMGPWCVHWWERFPSGYRLEMVIGDRDACFGDE